MQKNLDSLVASNSATIKHWISHECDKVLCVHVCTFFPFILETVLDVVFL